ncbi:hypothetical protein IMSHALPRED_007154 [Imshaugia aleurites]|uniref:Uncharacterized protein n=1 Tax=Imshaugia aleurites TaxID=172621 RepID=A0A8H3IGI5_9LECA|nr:hypothetical protein IMSHALPRED_007154 [Imshaugia aleurites]
MSKSTLVFIPGLWEGPTAFSKVVDILNSQTDYPTQVITLPSTGTTAPDAKTFSSDVAAIRDAIEKLANEGKEWSSSCILPAHTLPRKPSKV